MNMNLTQVFCTTATLELFTSFYRNRNLLDESRVLSDNGFAQFRVVVNVHSISSSRSGNRSISSVFRLFISSNAICTTARFCCTVVVIVIVDNS